MDLLDDKISEIEDYLAKVNSNMNPSQKESNDHKQSYIIKLNKLKFLKARIPNCISNCETLEQIEKLAIAKLNLNAVSYFISGANSEITLNRNKDFFQRILIKPRILNFKNTQDKNKNKNNFNYNNDNNLIITRNKHSEKSENKMNNINFHIHSHKNQINLNTKILGNDISLPVGFSPSALHKLAYEDGEISSAKAAYNSQSIFILSSRASSTIEEVAKANKTGLRWFQLYAMKNVGSNIEMIREAEKHGFSALVLTVDAPTIGYRDRDFQIKFKKPDHIHYAVEKHLLDSQKQTNKEREEDEKLLQVYSINKINENSNAKEDKHKDMDKDNYSNNKIQKIHINNTNAKEQSIEKNNAGLNYSSNNNNNFNYYKNSTDSSLDWSIIDWLRSKTKMPIILKGITNISDAVKAAQFEVNGIIISNHGGRQLDTNPSTIEVLEAIKNELEIFYGKNQNKKKIELYIDSGFRKGSDIFKALAYGAKAVFIGRPVVWGLAAGGENGVNKVLEILKHELELSMRIAGCSDISEINEDCVYNCFHAKF